MDTNIRTIRLLKRITLVLGALLFAGVGGPALAAADPDSVSFTLEGCRNDGTITLPIAGKFVCPDSAYTTGNLGKGWNELDLVPHRITAKAGNSAPASQTYAIAISADNCDGATGYPYICADGSTRRPGYDVMGSDDPTGKPVLNTSLSDASCSALSSTAQQALAPGVGGTAVSIARVLTITQLKNTTCVYDYYERLALGSHLFPGSSLHSNLLNQNYGTQGIGAKDVSIPVKEISPQELSKDMDASQGANNLWSITKEGTPASVSFGNVCAADAPQPQAVSIKVKWTLTVTAGGVNVTTNVYATNPASRTITTNVTDQIYTDAAHTMPLGSPSEPVSVDVPANSTVLVMTNTQTFDPPPAGIGVGSVLYDVATATYTDKDTGIVVPGQTEAEAQATITAGDTSNAMVDVTDTESISGTGLTFKVTSPIDGYVGSPAYVAGTATVGPVDWLASGQTASGEVTFLKSVLLDAKRITSGSLTDTAKIMAGATELGSYTLSTSISSTAAVSLKITKTVPDILNAGEKFEVTFHIAGTVLADPNDPNSAYSNDVTLTFNPGDTSKSITLGSLLPDTYTVTETGNLWYAAGSSTGIPGLLTPVGGDQQSKALLPNGDGIFTADSCSGEVTFANAIPAEEYAHAQVRKITNPQLTSGDPDYSWDFTLKLGTTTIATATAGAGAGYVDFGVDLVDEGTYTVIETTKTGWDLVSATLNNGSDLLTCTFTINYPQDEGATKSCTFTNNKRGKAKVLKTVQGSAPSGTQSFTFTLREGASTIADGTTLDTQTANAANGGVLEFASLLVAGNTYQMCEDVMPGWNTSLSNPPNMLFVPNSIIPPTLPNPNVNNMTVCVDFTAVAGDTTEFTVDNSPPPGGRALTIGFWKNWASCKMSGGNQKPVLDATLYGILPSGIQVGEVKSVTTAHKNEFSFFGESATETGDCANAVSLLDKRDFNGKKQASDPLFNMAAQLVAAELNLAAGAYTCGPVVIAISQANTLLSKYMFDGYGYTGKLSKADATSANNLAKRLDDYNNNRAAACM